MKYSFQQLTAAQKKFVAAHPKLFVQSVRKVMIHPKYLEEADLDKIVLALLSMVDGDVWHNGADDHAGVPK
jgi:hypothetical protein